jgi:hypothetical protein
MVSRRPRYGTAAASGFTERAEGIVEGAVGIAVKLSR